MKFLKREWFTLLIVILSIGAGVVFYHILPDTIPTHWNINGVADSYGPKVPAVLLMIGTMLFIVVIFMLAPLLDKRAVTGENESVWKTIRNIILLFFFLLQCVLFILISAGVTSGFSAVFLWFIGLLFVVLGFYMPKMKQNGIMGIRVSWTMKSEKVWDASHRFGGKVFMGAGVLAILGGFISISNPIAGAIIGILGPLPFLLIVVLVYPYLLSRKEESDLP